MIAGPKFKIGHVTWPRLFQRRFAVHGLGACSIVM